MTPQYYRLSVLEVDMFIRIDIVMEPLNKQPWPSSVWGGYLPVPRLSGNVLQPHTD